MSREAAQDRSPGWSEAEPWVKFLKTGALKGRRETLRVTPLTGPVSVEINMHMGKQAGAEIVKCRALGLAGRQPAPAAHRTRQTTDPCCPTDGEGRRSSGAVKPAMETPRSSRPLGGRPSMRQIFYSTDPKPKTRYKHPTATATQSSFTHIPRISPPCVSAALPRRPPPPYTPTRCMR